MIPGSTGLRVPPVDHSFSLGQFGLELDIEGREIVEIDLPSRVVPLVRCVGQDRGLPNLGCGGQNTTGLRMPDQYGCTTPVADAQPMGSVMRHRYPGPDKSNPLEWERLLALARSLPFSSSNLMGLPMAKYRAQE